MVTGGTRHLLLQIRNGGQPVWRPARCFVPGPSAVRWPKGSTKSMPPPNSRRRLRPFCNDIPRLSSRSWRRAFAKGTALQSAGCCSQLYSPSRHCWNRSTPKTRPTATRVASMSGSGTALRSKTARWVSSPLHIGTQAIGLHEVFDLSHSAVPVLALSRRAAVQYMSSTDVLTREFMCALMGPLSSGWMWSASLANQPSPMS